MVKRKVHSIDDDAHAPSKRSKTSTITAAITTNPIHTTLDHRSARTPTATPSKLRTVLNPQDIPDEVTTPSSVRKVLFLDATTSRQRNGAAPVTETPTSTVAERVLDRDDGEDVDDDSVLDRGTVSQSTPVATPKLRGRPRGSKNKERSPTPPHDMPPHERYFFQNRAGGSKTSDNELPRGALLNHDDYFAQIKAYSDPHTEDVDFLAKLHSRAFDQWMFELQCNFAICLYGYGSKRSLVACFLAHISDSPDSTANPPKILIINGYNPALTIKEIITCLSRTLVPATVKVPAQPSAAMDVILEQLTDSPTQERVLLVIHSLDAAPLRKHQLFIARLAAHPSVSLLATVDTPNFALLWPLPLQAQFRFLYHDATTFRPYDAEIETVDEVNSLLGRSGRRVGGKDGVVFVLRSLPENARLLFRLLVAEQLTLLDAGLELNVRVDRRGGGVGDDGSEVDDEEGRLLGFDDAAGEDEEDGDEDAMDIDPDTPSRRGRGKAATTKRRKRKAGPGAGAGAKRAGGTKQVEGVEFRMLYHKAVEQFICSSDMGFRTLLKEFHDHQIVESRRDGLGSERLIVPFGRAELESLMEELV